MGIINCINPTPDNGITSIGISDELTDAEKESFSRDIKKLAVNKHISFAFAKIILEKVKCYES